MSQLASGELRNSLFISTNNDFLEPGWAEACLSVFHNSPGTVFVAWILDNHHWYPLSTYLAVHPDYMFLLARCNRCTFGPVCAGVAQWTRTFLRENETLIMSRPRSDQALGTHVFHEQFRFRNQVLNTLAQHYPGVAAQKVGYH